ncbi:MAG: polysaccharide deacetylase family protein [Candidatus Sumerlaeaceae bacterium]|nr:polysaccharide deacetylase family protein [Candidatus Sumerlaeaceae bacterium]
MMSHYEKTATNYSNLALFFLMIVPLAFSPYRLSAQTAPDKQSRLRPRVIERFFPRHKGRTAPKPAGKVSERNNLPKPHSSVTSPPPKRVITSPHRAIRSATPRRGYTAISSKSDMPTTGPRPVTRWPTGQKLIALTYDDGPNPQITPRLVALLKSKGVRATFFLLGDSVRAYPQLVKQLADAGMELGNHSDSHRQFTKLGSDAIAEELRRNEERIRTVVPDVSMKVMRPPYGAYNSVVMRVAEQMGYKVILWDVDTNDWRRRTTEQMVSTIVNNARDGSIILMHDRYETSLQTTARIIDVLEDQGFRFVTLSELLAQPRYEGLLEPSSQ